MNTEFDIKVGEVGLVARDALEELYRRRLNGKPIATYAYDEPGGWSDIAEGGWDLIGASEEAGGADASLRDLIDVARVHGRWLPPLPVIESILAKRWSPAAREHDAPATIAVTTESGRVVVPFGAYPGVRILTGIDGVEQNASLEQDDYAPSLRMAVSEAPTSLPAGAAREFAILWASEAVGCAERVLDEAVKYAKERTQFGQPIGRFQAVKHHLANALIAVQEAESAVLWAAADAPRLEPALELAFDSATRAIEIGIQVHGGMGFTWELGLHVYLRQVVSLRLLALALARTVDGS